MEKEIYTPMEKVLIEGVQTLDRLTVSKMETQALELDLMLLEMEEKMGLMDGVELKEWIL